MKVGTILNKPQTNPIMRNGNFILRASSPAEIKELLMWSSLQNTPINFKLRNGSLMTGVAINFNETDTVSVKIHAKLENDEFTCFALNDIPTVDIAVNSIESAEPFCFINV